MLGEQVEEYTVVKIDEQHDSHAYHPSLYFILYQP